MSEKDFDLFGVSIDIREKSNTYIQESGVLGLTTVSPTGVTYTSVSAEDHFFISRGREDLVPGCKVVG